MVCSILLLWYLMLFHVWMLTDSKADWRRGPGPEMLPTGGPPGGRPFSRQLHYQLPPPPFMYTSYQPQHQASVSQKHCTFLILLFPLILPSFPLALQFRVSFGLLNNLVSFHNHP
jgi:hypothetical protein